MNSLLKWQVFSLISRLTAMAVGLFQTFFIIRILTPEEWGIIQIGMAIGGAFGIYQHLGLSSGTTREISTAKNDTDVFKIFVTGVGIRYLVTVPIAIFLFFSAENIAVAQYSQPSLILPVKIYSVVLLIQGIKGLMNSVVSGTKRFKYLFLFQSGVSVLSALVYIPLVYYRQVEGFFYAFFIFEVLSTLILGYLAFRPLEGRLEMPSKQDFIRLTKQLSSIVFAVYFVKILVTQWEKAGTLLLGLDVTPEQVAIFSFAFLFAKKLMHISDAITDVNLPVLSNKFEENMSEFVSLFSQNLNKIFAFMVFSALSAVFWSNELVYIFVGNNEVYKQSLQFIIPLIFTFIFYGIINILKSSVFIPGKYIKSLIGGYLFMFLATVGGYFFGTRYLYLDPVFTMTYATLLGAFVGFMYLVVTSQSKIGSRYINLSHYLILVQVLGIMLLKDLSFLIKIPTYIFVSLSYVYAVYLASFITKEDFTLVYNKIRKKFQ